MAIVTGGTMFPLDMDNLFIGDLFDYTQASTSSTEARYFDDANNFTLFRGVNLVYNSSDDFIQGTVNSVRYVVNGSVVLQITGGSVGADKIHQYQVAEQTMPLLRLALRNADTMTGTPLDDVLYGFNGADTIGGGGGADDVDGGEGDDIVKGGAGADTLTGRLGIDTADFSDKTVSVSVTLGQDSGVPVHVNGVVEDRISSFENVDGGSGNDSLVGDGLGNTFTGNGGKDVLSGNDGDDGLLGGAGDDTLVGGAGQDVMDGGDGTDTADYRAELRAVSVTLDGSNVASVSLDGVPEDGLQNVENMLGGSFTDTLVGDDFFNKLSGNNGDDSLAGAGGKDALVGGAGFDTLNGGADQDRLTGGGGEDRFVYLALSDSGITAATRDQIVGFLGGDRIDVSAIDAVPGGADNPFRLDQGGAFLRGEIRQLVAGNNITLQFNADADAAPEMTIYLPGVSTPLVAGDFVL